MINFINRKWSQYKEAKRKKNIIAKSKVKAQLEELEDSIEELKVSHDNFKKYTDRIVSLSSNQEGSEMFDEFID